MHAISYFTPLYTCGHTVFKHKYKTEIATTRLHTRCLSRLIEFAAETVLTQAAGLAKELTLANQLAPKRESVPDRHTTEIEDLALDPGFHNENTLSPLNKQHQHAWQLTIEYFGLCPRC